jgi:hypothetical protein
MPLGNEQWSSGEIPPIMGPISAPPMGEGGAPAPGQDRHGPSADIWKSVVLQTGALWTPGVAINFGGPVSVLEILAGVGDELFIGWISQPNSGLYTAGTYQLHHPGGGELVKVVPNITQVWVATATGASPVANIDVVGRGGRYGAVVGGF